MELPHIGKHCLEPTCYKLDFLPFVCNLCQKEFCVDHHAYAAHNCTESYKADVRVPICPLCNQPVPSKSGQSPDLAVNDHMENNCKDKKKKIYTNKCSAPGCKGREMVPVSCDSCGQNFCLRHRHSTDHDCKGPMTRLDRAALAAANRSSSKDTKQSSRSNGIFKNLTPRPTGHSPMARNANTSLQAGMTEDEALAFAMAASMQEADVSTSPQEFPSSNPNNDDDELLAQAIAASLGQNQSQNQRTTRNSCNIC